MKKCFGVNATVRHIETGQVMVIIDHYGDPLTGDRGTYRSDLIGNVEASEIEAVDTRTFYRCLKQQSPSKRMISDYAERLGFHITNTSIPENTYEPSHPGYHHLGGSMIHPDDIKGSNMDEWVKNIKSFDKMTFIKKQHQADIENDIKVYMTKLRTDFRSNIDLCNGVATKRNHIAYHRGIVESLDKTFGSQATLF